MDLNGADFVMVDLNRYECINNLCWVELTSAVGCLLGTIEKSIIVTINLVNYNAVLIIHYGAKYLVCATDYYKIHPLFNNIPPADIINAIIRPKKSNVTYCGICDQTVFVLYTRRINKTTSACNNCIGKAREFTRTIFGRYLLLSTSVVYDIAGKILSTWLNPYYYNIRNSSIL